MSAYCASKYTVEPFSDCLRREMFPWDLRVNIIELEFMRTLIIEGHFQQFLDFWNTLTNDVKERWGEESLKAQYS
jgi:NAD(P)-dependent dehydrogenase (short-subunit alcohol dehydrogenase family)